MYVLTKGKMTKLEYQNPHSTKYLLLLLYKVLILDKGTFLNFVYKKKYVVEYFK